MNREMKAVGIRKDYDLLIVGFYAVGGVATYLYQLWNYLNNNGVRSLLVMNFDQIRHLPDHDVINLKNADFSLVGDFLRILMPVTFRKVYIVQLDSIPYFLPLIEKKETFLHMEYWPHELPLAMSRLNASYTIFEREFTRQGRQMMDHWFQLMKYTECFDKRWYNRHYLICYWLSLLHSKWIGLWIKKDLKEWMKLLNKTIVNKEKLLYLPPTVDTEMFRPATRIGDLSIVVNGRKTHKDNFFYTLMAIQENFIESRCRVFITGIDHLPENVRLSQSMQVSCTGFVPYNKQPGNYGKGQLYILLSKSHEGFSVSVLEAMACGCTPIVSNFIASNMGGIVKNGETGYVITDLKQLRKLLKILKCNPDKMQEIGKRARKAIEEWHSFDRLRREPFFANLLLRRCASSNKK